MAKIAVTMTKSGIGYPENQKKTLRSLGLRRLGQQVTHQDSAAVRGMINKVRHLVTVEEVK
ncbi:MAG: 50S ribosomal protein L30 [Dehalococcoidia bacterium]|nr:MAG: 50S ribosomal protein L30 [Dehalococcoidia bacterium]